MQAKGQCHAISFPLTFYSVYMLQCLYQKHGTLLA